MCSACRCASFAHESTRNCPAMPGSASVRCPTTSTRGLVRRGPGRGPISSARSSGPSLPCGWNGWSWARERPTILEERLATADGLEHATDTEAGDEPFAARVLARYPDLELLSPEASAMFMAALTRLAVGEPRMALDEQRAARPRGRPAVASLPAAGGVGLPPRAALPDVFGLRGGDAARAERPHAGAGRRRSDRRPRGLAPARAAQLSQRRVPGTRPLGGRNSRGRIDSPHRVVAGSGGCGVVVRVMAGIAASPPAAERSDA